MDVSSSFSPAPRATVVASPVTSVSSDNGVKSIKRNRICAVLFLSDYICIHRNGF